MTLQVGPTTAVRTTLEWTLAGTLLVGAGANPKTLDRAMVLVQVTAIVNLAPTGAALIVDLNSNGASVFTSQASRPTIPAGSLSATVSGLAIALSAGSQVVPDIDQVGSTFAGGALTVQAVLIG